ncbi:hypothetical protein AKJ16_DCAP12731 [Drosera capensis]
MPVELADLAPQRVTPTNVVAERASSDPRRPSGEDVNTDINVADRQNSVPHTPGPWGGMDQDSIRWRLRHLQQQQMRSQSSSSGPRRNSFVMLGFSAHLDEPHSSSRGDSSPGNDASSSCHRCCTEGRSQVTGDQVSFRSRVHSVVHCFRQIGSPSQDPGMWGATPRKTRVDRPRDDNAEIPPVSQTLPVDAAGKHRRASQFHQFLQTLNRNERLQPANPQEEERFAAGNDVGTLNCMHIFHVDRRIYGLCAKGKAL